MGKPIVFFIIGTRPDTIKSVPVYTEFLKYEHILEPILISTGQHRDMVNQALEVFNLRLDIDLNIMEHGQSLAQISTRAMEGLDKLVQEFKPSLIFAQGDTTTTFIAGLVSFYRQISFCHIEAGLRSESIWNPFPEEFNRRAVALFAHQHFAPTQQAAQNLIREGINSERVYVTGNTGIDAVKQVAAIKEQTWFSKFPGRVILLTTHRRENWGEPQKSVCLGLKRLVENFDDIKLVVPLHPNPKVRETIQATLKNHERIEMIEPPEYSEFVKLIQKSHLIFTDSGGIQEEAPFFNVPVLVLRENTERPEAIESGVAKLVGTDEEKVYEAGYTLLSNQAAYQEMKKGGSPFGDGKAAQRIRYLALNLLEIESPEEELWI